MSQHSNTSHVVIQKRRVTVCMYCRVPMDPESTLAKKDCPKRTQREDSNAGHRTLSTIEAIGEKMKSEHATKKRRGTRKHATAGK